MVSDDQIFGLILHTAAMKISYQNEEETDTECCFLSLSRQKSYEKRVNTGNCRALFLTIRPAQRTFKMARCN